MFQSLVITLREGVEGTLIVGIVLAYLAKTGRRTWSRIVWAGVAAAIVASLVAAYFVHRLAMSEDAYEGWLMLAGSAFVASMVWWMWTTGKRMKQEIETKLSELASQPTRAASLGLFLFVLLMVFREGIETVLLLAAVSFRSTDLLNFIGGIIGLSLAIGLGVAFFKGSIKVDLRKFFTVTSLVLIVVAAQLLVTGVHELSEAQVLPSSQREMKLVGPIVNNDVFFFVVIVALCLFLVIAHKIQQAGAAAADLATSSAPERRKALAEWRRERFWKMSASSVSLLIIVLISAQFIDSRAAQAPEPSVPVAMVNGVARIPTSDLTDHKLHHYKISAGGAEVRLIAILDDTDSVRVGLDACEICGNKGYYQDGKNVICRNCAAAIYVPTIGLAGGCNPVHITFVVEGNSLTFSESALAAAAKYFQ